jgi:stage V sporulation protein B
LGVRTANAAAVLPAILVAAVVYFVVLLLLRGVPERELRMLPKGEKICAVLRKVKLI